MLWGRRRRRAAVLGILVGLVIGGAAVGAVLFVSGSARLGSSSGPLSDAVPRAIPLPPPPVPLTLTNGQTLNPGSQIPLAQHVFDCGRTASDAYARGARLTVAGSEFAVIDTISKSGSSYTALWDATNKNYVEAAAKVVGEGVAGCPFSIAGIYPLVPTPGLASADPSGLGVRDAGLVGAPPSTRAPGVGTAVGPTAVADQPGHADNGTSNLALAQSLTGTWTLDRTTLKCVNFPDRCYASPIIVRVDNCQANTCLLNRSDGA